MTETPSKSSDLSIGSRIFNVNIGILGHVDSGKTTLSKALSIVSSTAAFDKSPQSKERGITLDLGFSCFYDTESCKSEDFDAIQYTLVDCPGHASLIRTIIGGSQIIDAMILVIDVTKGIQTQTAECIVIGEITCENLVVVLNKIDQIPENKRAEKINKMKQSLYKNVFSSTKFKQPPIIAISAAKKEGISELIKQLGSLVKVPTSKEKHQKDMDHSEKFLFAVDHCFAIKGKGTVLTGTVLQGRVEVNQTIELPALKEQKKVKSLQMFKKSVQVAHCGDRVGLLVTKLEADRFERGYAADPGLITTISSVIARVEKIKYFKRPVETKAKFHISVGHSTVMGTVMFFELIGNNFEKLETSEFNYCDCLPEKDSNVDKLYFARIDLQTPTVCYPHARFIASKLDTDINQNVCRLAFHGELMPQLDLENTSDSLDKVLKVYKQKEKTAQIDRVIDEYSVIAKNIVKKKVTADYMTPYIGKKITLEIKEKTNDDNSNSVAKKYEGRIESTFGNSGKFKVRFVEPIPKLQKTQSTILRLRYKINVFDKNRNWITEHSE